MYGRFLHPVIPLVYLSAEISLRRLLGARRRYLLAAFLVIPLVVVFEKSLRDALFIEPNGERKGAFALRGITDEYWYWSQTETFNGINPIRANELIGRQLEVYFRGTKVQVLLRGQASLGYYARFHQAIENAGLTDAYIAKLPLADRGRPGHEKNAPLEYLVNRGVHFVFFRSPYDTAFYRFVNFRIGGGSVRAEMFVYDRELMRHLRTRFPNDVQFIDFEEYLDSYIRTLSRKPPDVVRADYERFRSFYFAKNSDPAREAHFLEYLRE
jgi:hypothetical protein